MLTILTLASLLALGITLMAAAIRVTGRRSTASDAEDAHERAERARLAYEVKRSGAQHGQTS